MPEGVHLTDRGLFRVWSREVARFGDTDRQGHVNNAVFATFCESGRVAFLHPEEGPLAPPGHAFVIARLALDFRAELHWRDVVEIGTGVLGLGRSSFTLGQGLFRGENCVATAECVMVLTDARTRRPTPLPGGLRAHLEGFAIAPASARLREGVERFV